MIRVLLLSALSLGFLVPAQAQQDVAGKIDAFVQAELKRQNIPGISLAVIRNGEVPLVRAYGMANLEHQVPVEPETIFQSGSVGKQFTSAAVMLLAEDGKLTVDDKVSKHLGAVPAAWTDLTIRHLLTHTGGLTDYPKGFDFRKDYTEDELLKTIQAVPLAFAPGERHAYSNLGYVTLGILISKVTGKFYGEFLQERIFKPLDMTSARIISETAIVPNRAAGYRLQQGQLRNQEWVSPTLNTTADGSLYLTILDMVKWEAALRSTTFLRPESRTAMWTPYTLNSGTRGHYGFGWQIGRRAGHLAIEHGGAWQGFVAYILRFPDDGLTVILFANRSGASMGTLATGIARIVNPDLAEKPAPDSEPATTAAHRKLFEALRAGPLVDKSIFTDEVAKDILPRIDSSRPQLKAFGAIEAFELLERSAKEDFRTHRYRIRFQTDIAILTIVLNKDGKIAGLNLQPE